MDARFRLPVRVFYREAVRAIARNRMRSALSALGITIGIAAVVWMVALGQAGSRRAEEQLDNLGDNLVWVEAGSRNINGVRNGTHGTTSLTLDDVEAIRREAPEVTRVSPNADGSVRIAFGNRNWVTHYRGVSPEFLKVKNWDMAMGTAFSADQVDQVASVCLLGQTARERLFGAADPVGRTVRIQFLPFQVLGVLARKGQSSTGQDQDDAVLLPYTTAQRTIRGKGFVWLDDILCSAASRQAVDPAIRRITGILRARHRIGPGEEDDFNIRRPDEAIKAQIETSRTLALLLISIASVSLVVGGVGIMNVMLASVAERTREIGLRLAIGATERDVQLQFLGESIVLSLVGGLAGVVLGVVGTFALGRALDWSVSLPLEAIVLALAFSVAVGVFFGYYPAWKASRLDPIEALRYE